MSSMDDRQKAFENKFAHDAELQFKAEARRNKLLGMWAADKMGIVNEEEAKAYATEVVKADFEEAGDEDVYRKVSGDLEARGVDCSEAELREKMASFLSEAKTEIMNEVE